MLKNDKITSEMKDLAEGQIRELQKEISFDTKDYPIEVLVDKFRADDFYIPEYQRKFVWDNANLYCLGYLYLLCFFLIMKMVDVK